MIYWFYMHEFFLFLSATVCGNAHTEVHTCLVGLQDHLRKAKSLLLELEGFMENVASAMQAAETSSSELPEETCKNGLDHQAMVFDKVILSFTFTF